MEIAEYDGAGTLLRRYIPGGAIDVRVAYIEGSGTAAANIEYYHADRLGNVSALSDDVGNITDRYAYDPFGHECEVLSPAPGAPCEVGPPSTSGQLFRYTGRKYDPETGLYYYRARYYCPDCGRFLSTDPVGYEAGFNLYTYTLNDPLNNTDATGLNPGIDRRADNAFKAVRSCTASTSCTRTAKAVISTGVDFIPIVGDIKGAIEFAQNPSFLGAAAVIVGIAPGLGDVASKGLKQLDNVKGARFITDPKGQTVDLSTTPRGSFDQPNGGRTDILQAGDHGAGNSHTHQPDLNTNPETGKEFVNGFDNGQPVTAEELKNIQDGTAPKSTARGR